MKLHTILALALAMAQGSAVAADDIEQNRNWQVSAELGAITTTGNTSGTSITGRIDAHQELADWSNEYIASGFFKEDKYQQDGERFKERSAQRYSLSAKAAYKLMEEDEKLFMLAAHVEDKFGAYTRYSTLAIGHGSRWYRSESKTVDVELGPGYFTGVRATGEAENGITVRGAAALRWKLSPSANFSQTVSIERGTSNMHSIAETALSTKINGTMQMKAAFIARNDSNVPEDRKNTDTQTSLTLVYSF